MTTTPAREQLLALFANRKYGKTHAAQLVDAHAAEVRAAALDAAADRLEEDDHLAAAAELREWAAAARPDNTTGA